MQGFNMGRYRPPSTLDAALSASDTPAPKARRVNAAAPPTVRFEMPFAIWCSTCPERSSSQLIGQGVRFNALKKKVGNYYSTPVWSFRVKHTACGGWIEIRTDPQNSEYVVTEGARRRDTGDDLAVASRVGGVVIGGSSGPGEDNERERKRQDAFAALEGKKDEAVRAKGEAARIEELKSLRERDWRDADESSRKLRNAFRVGRRKRDKDAQTAEALQDRMGLGFELLEETDEDQKRAGLVDFGSAADGVDNIIAERRATMKPLFNGGDATSNGRREKKPQSKLVALHKELAGNTRIAIDPFTVANPPVRTLSAGRVLPGVKRKRDNKTVVAVQAEELQGHQQLSPATTHEQTINESAPTATKSSVCLVNYDSD